MPTTPLAPTGLPTMTIAFTNAGGNPVELLVEIADSPEERTRGLMFRENLLENAGMLFEFDGQTQTGFWMKNTAIPLSIAFIDSNDVIIDIQDMTPLLLDLHTPSAPYAYAVEANQGWFARNGVKVGSATLIAAAPAQ